MLLTVIGVCASGSVALIALMTFATSASQSTANIFKSWCRMFGGQVFLQVMNAG